jgi:dephospho-CoA kinase
MLKSRRVAITGGLSSGKSSVCRFFNELGAKVVSADQIVHTLLNPNTELGHQIIELLGNNIVIDSGPSKGQFDRKKIAESVFQKPEKLKKLESLLHPAVRVRILEEAQLAEQDPSIPLFVAEIPLFFESGNHNEDYEGFIPIVVIADENECQKRFVEKTKEPPEEFARRMKQQMSPKEKARNATYIIYNQGTLQDLKIQVEGIFKQLTQNP